MPRLLETTEEGIRRYDAKRHAQLAAAFGGHDPGVCALLCHAVGLSLRGLADQARCTVERALLLPILIASTEHRVWLQMGGDLLDDSSRPPRLHGRIADVLAEHFPTTVEAEPEVMAHHYREAGMADAASTCFERAGDRAVRAHELGCEVDDGPQLFRATWGLRHVTRYTDNNKQSRKWNEELTTLAQRLGDEGLLLEAQHCRVVTGLVFGKLFFPTSEPLVGVPFQAFAVYAVGFLAQPDRRGNFPGPLRSRIGRKATLIATLLITGFATFAVGLVPTYKLIGIWGAVRSDDHPRFLQGIGVRRRMGRLGSCCRWSGRASIPIAVSYASWPAILAAPGRKRLFHQSETLRQGKPLRFRPAHKVAASPAETEGQNSSPGAGRAHSTDPLRAGLR